MINSLTGIRALAALAVFLFHASVIRIDGGRININSFDYSVIRNGDFGVDIFFVLSGYVIALAYGAWFDVFKFNLYAKFIYARLIRLLPVHLLTMVIMMAAFHIFVRKFGGVVGSAENFGFNSVFLNIFMLHEWFSSNNFLINLSVFSRVLEVLGEVGSPNSVSWSISAEFFAYILFPLIFKIIRVNGFFSLMVLLFGGYYLAINEVIPRDGLLRVIFCFSIGAWVRLYLNSIVIELKILQRWLGLCFLIILLSLMAQFRLADGGAPYFVAGVLTSLLIWAVGNSGDSLGKILSYKFLVYFGEISYSFYMIHWFSLKFFERILLVGTDYSQLRAIWYVVLSLIFSFFVAAVIYRYFENPIRNILRRKN